MSTTNLNGIEQPTTDSSFRYLNRGLQLLGLFFFVNGIYVAFFSANIITTLGYYFVVIAAVCGVLSQAFSPDNPLISPETQAAARRLLNRRNREPSRRSRSRRGRTKRRTGFDVRRYLRTVSRKFDEFELGRSVSRRKGRDRL
ncbi:hypothetical protein [Haladaptatus salinisoli]|uniref:hypothetical protein n=1 Tax=Haladaptatus salinisoli TaxID=2884876 RepID=UPI001D0A4F94|nr:hypothetical protein [Haladaptatus salinisoli]